MPCRATSRLLDSLYTARYASGVLIVIDAVSVRPFTRASATAPNPIVHARYSTRKPTTRGSAASPPCGTS